MYDVCNTCTINVHIFTHTHIYTPIAHICIRISTPPAEGTGGGDRAVRATAAAAGPGASSTVRTTATAAAVRPGRSEGKQGEGGWIGWGYKLGKNQRKNTRQALTYQTKPQLKREKQSPNILKKRK